MIRFNDYFDNFSELSIQQIAILCPFSADRSSELIRRKSSVTYTALQYRICLEWSYILSKNSSFRDDIIVTTLICDSNHLILCGHIPLILIL